MTHRRARLGHVLRQALSEILATRVADARLSALTIIEVRAAPDASFARVFYRSFDADREGVARALEKAKPFLRHCLAGSLQGRRVPELEFRYDPAQDSAERLETILDELGQNAKDSSQK